MLVGGEGALHNPWQADVFMASLRDPVEVCGGLHVQNIISHSILLAT